MKKSILVLVILAVVLAGCSSAASVAPEYGAPGMEDGSSSEPNYAPAPPLPSVSKGVDEYSYDLQEEIERVVLKNASIEIVTADPVASADTISRMAEEMGGFVVNSNIYRTTTAQGIEVPEANITVRVPADRLTEAMDRIKALVGDPGEDVRNENITGQDVTLEYTDLQSRLRNKEDAAAALRKILEDANRTEDVLMVYQELNRVTEEIEVLKGQIKYYDESARLSAITVRIQSQEAVAPISVAGWEPVGVARDALQALVDTLQLLTRAAIWLVVFCLPLGLLLAIPGFFILRGFRRYRARRKAAPPVED